ncbi:MAG TPA: signal peptidase I [Lachnospiraceae bacterium]|nr:signal peptidase I [Lachnospiraceae bacterium]
MNKFTKTLIKIVAGYLCFIIILYVIFQKVLMLSLIPSSSMADTLLPGDLIISTRYDIGMEDIDRYDILIFTLPDEPEQEYIKRVIGLPGETIEIRTNGKVYADDVELDDAFIKEPMEWYDNDNTYVVPEGCYFFLGDNRNHSEDSRYWGKYVPVENVLAKEKFIIIRLSDFGYKGNES